MGKTKNALELVHEDSWFSEQLKKNTSAKASLQSAEKEYDRLKNEFFNNISHELRTPINVVLGSIQVFEMMGDDLLLDSNRDKFKVYRRIMKQNCYRLLRLVNNLIDVTMMNEGNVKLFPENMDIVKAVNVLADLAKGYAEKKGLSLVFNSNEEKIITAFDYDKISRVILNLLSNAIKFTPEGGKIQVSIKKDESKVYISVKDSGIGILSDKLDHIFERFFKIDGSLSRKHEGSGIGLALSSSIVKLHGGLIRVISKPGKGSTFIVQLPLRIAVSEFAEIKEGTELNLSPSEKIYIEFSDLV